MSGLNTRSEGFKFTNLVSGTGFASPKGPIGGILTHFSG